MKGIFDLLDDFLLLNKKRFIACSTSLRQNLTWEDLRKIMSDIRNEVEYDDDERTMFHR